MTKIEQFSNTEQPTIVLPNKSILSQSLSHGRMQIVSMVPLRTVSSEEIKAYVPQDLLFDFKRSSLRIS